MPLAPMPRSWRLSEPRPGPPPQARRPAPVGASFFTPHRNRSWRPAWLPRVPSPPSLAGVARGGGLSPSPGERGGTGCFSEQPRWSELGQRAPFGPLPFKCELGSQPRPPGPFHPPLLSGPAREHVKKPGSMPPGCAPRGFLSPMPAGMLGHLEQLESHAGWESPRIQCRDSWPDLGPDPHHLSSTGLTVSVGPVHLHLAVQQQSPKPPSPRSCSALTLVLESRLGLHP